MLIALFFFQVYSQWCATMSYATSTRQDRCTATVRAGHSSGTTGRRASLTRLGIILLTSLVYRLVTYELMTYKIIMHMYWMFLSYLKIVFIVCWFGDWLELSYSKLLWLRVHKTFILQCFARSDLIIDQRKPLKWFEG